jgi:hypothetical protein
MRVEFRETALLQTTLKQFHWMGQSQNIPFITSTTKFEQESETTSEFIYSTGV